MKVCFPKKSIMCASKSPFSLWPGHASASSPGKYHVCGYRLPLFNVSKHGLNRLQFLMKTRSIRCVWSNTANRIKRNVG